MLKAVIISATIVLCSVACSESNDQPVNKQPVNKQPDKEQLIKQAVLERLTDPDSAKFGKITVVKNNACATVNAKNKFGGYTGDKQVSLTKIDGQWFYVSVMKDIDKDVSHDFCVNIIWAMYGS